MLAEGVAILGEWARCAACALIGHVPSEHPHKWFDSSCDQCDRCEKRMPYSVAVSRHEAQRTAFETVYGPSW